MTVPVDPPPIDEVLTLLEDLVAFPSVALTPNVDLIAYVEDLLRPHCTDIVLTHDETGTKANLFATIGPAVDGGVMLAGHSDVVPVDPADWATPPFVATRLGDRIYGRGTADMKGFVACALTLVPRWAALDLVRPVHVALTFDEEDGFHGAPILIASLAGAPQPVAAIVGEPTGLQLIGAHKGCYEYTTTVTGMNGHSSRPTEAVSAVHHATRWIGALLDLDADLAGRARADSRFEPPHTTTNVGVVGGGLARCTVAGECSFEWEMRPVQGDDAGFVKERMAAVEATLLAEMRAVHPGAAIETEAVCEIDGLEWVEASPALDLMRSLLGGDPPVGVVAYGTEAGLYQAAGIPSVVWGPGDIAVAHRPDEFVEVADLEACLTVLAGLGDHLTR
ncbi:MAG: acetylornithine deacetylase [Acidimicrobiales bacterium]|nr:acetylornithine deacetylase [Acidimicrobiales bacterium]